MTSSTTFVLVPGAFHPASALDPIAELLRAAGYTVKGVDLPSCGAEPPLLEFGPDVDAISKTIADEADRGQDVVMFMHSYGGTAGTEACRGLGKKERAAAGRNGGLVRLIYCSSFMLPEGTSLLDMTGGKQGSGVNLSGNGTRSRPATPEETFYNDLSPDEAKKAANTLLHHSIKCFSSKVTYPAYKYIPTSYQLCKKDNALPLSLQEKMVEDVRALGVQIDTDTFDASHSPFLSMPDAVAAACIRSIGGSS